jgi:hypothetical protein
MILLAINVIQNGCNKIDFNAFEKKSGRPNYKKLFRISTKKSGLRNGTSKTPKSKTQAYVTQ